MIGQNRPPQAAWAQEPTEGVSMRSLLGVLRRRKLHFLVAVPLAVLAAAAAAYLLPARYRAEALVASDPIVGRDPLADTSPALDVERHLARITEVLYRRSLLEQVIQEFDLFPAARRISAQELEEMRSRIRIRVEGERSFSLGFEDGDRQRVAAVASRLANLLISNTRAEREAKAEARSEFIESQLPAIQRQLEEQERAIEQYKQTYVAEIPEQTATNLKLLEGVEERLQAVTAAIAEDEARRTGIQREMAELKRQGVSMEPPRNPAETRLEELRTSLAQLRRRYTEQHPEVVRAQAEIEELERAIAAGQTGPATAPEYSPVQLRYVQLAAELDAVEERLAYNRAARGGLAGESATYRGRIGAAPRHDTALAAMTRDYEATRTRYEELSKELNEARLAERLEKTNQGAVFRIVEAPRVPTEPVAPRRLRILLMGLALGLGLAMATALLAEQVDTSFRNVEEVESALQLPVLATIPSLPARGGQRGEGHYPPVASLEEPHGLAAEQYRILATKLLRQAGGSRPLTVLVTSPVGEEGKSTTAVNLALALSRLVDEEVLLVDADLRRPTVHQLLEMPASSGLSTLLANPDDDPSRYVRRQHGLAVLEAGRSSPRLRAALASPLAQRVFQRLRQRFGYVVIDAPPLLAVAEGLILQQMVDSILLVVRARKTSKEASLRAVDSLDSPRLAGVVLNDVDASTVHIYPYRYFEQDEGSAVMGGRVER